MLFFFAFKSVVGATIIALIQSAVHSYLVIYSSSEATHYDEMPGAVFEFNGPCDFVTGANTWKLLAADMICLALLDVIPFVAICIMNVSIIRTLKRRAETWGREDPQKLVISHSFLLEDICKTCGRSFVMVIVSRTDLPGFS